MIDLVAHANFFMYRGKFIPTEYCFSKVRDTDYLVYVTVDLKNLSFTTEDLKFNNILTIYKHGIPTPDFNTEATNSDFITIPYEKLKDVFERYHVPKYRKRIIGCRGPVQKKFFEEYLDSENNGIQIEDLYQNNFLEFLKKKNYSRYQLSNIHRGYHIFLDETHCAVNVARITARYLCDYYEALFKLPTISEYEELNNFVDNELEKSYEEKKMKKKYVYNCFY